MSKCCYLEAGEASGKRCEKRAEFMIIEGPAPDEYTESCELHVGQLISDKVLNGGVHVYHIPEES